MNVNAHPLYQPVLKLTQLFVSLSMGGDVDIVHHLAEALLLLKDAVDDAPATCLTKVLAGHAFFLLGQVFTMYQLRCTAQADVANLLEEHRAGDRPQPKEPPTADRKAKHDPAAIAVLKEWLFNHVGNPYPTPAEKETLHHVTNLTPNQLNDWFVNARRRILKKPASSQTPDTA